MSLQDSRIAAQLARFDQHQPHLQHITINLIRSQSPDRMVELLKLINSFAEKADTTGENIDPRRLVMWLADDKEIGPEAALSALSFFMSLFFSLSVGMATKSILAFECAKEQGEQNEL